MMSFVSYLIYTCTYTWYMYIDDGKSSKGDQQQQQQRQGKAGGGWGFSFVNHTPLVAGNLPIKTFGGQQ